MTASVRLVLVLFVGGWLAITALVLQPTFIDALAPGGGFFPDSSEPSARERRRTETLDALLQAVQQRQRARYQLAQDVIAGRLTLVEAAAHFRDFTTPPADPRLTYWEAERRRASQGEAYCRAVIGWVEYVLGQTKQRDPGLLARLNAELETLRQEAGTISLTPSSRQ